MATTKKRPTYKTLEVCCDYTLKGGSKVYVSGKSRISVDGAASRELVYCRYPNGKQEQYLLADFIDLIM